MNQQETVWLEGIAGQYQGQKVPLPPGSTLLGRSQACDVRISAANVSRQHAKIRYAQGQYFLQDQDSALGTRVNGRAVRATALQDGDTITIGECTFRFRRQQHAPASSDMVPQTPAPAVPQEPRQAQADQPQVVVQQPQQPQKPEQPSAQEQGQAISDGVAKGIALHKSFVSQAFLTLLLYYVGFYIVGLIFNVVYLVEANRIQKMAGQSPSGKGCLTFLLITHLVGPVLIVILFLVTGGAILSELSSYY